MVESIKLLMFNYFDHLFLIGDSNLDNQEIEDLLIFFFNRDIKI